MRLLALTFLILILTGCGQKGPLYLPESDRSESYLTEYSNYIELMGSASRVAVVR